MKLLLAGGGTGGHLVPGLAVADALRARDPDARLWVFGTPRPIDRKLVPSAGIPLFEQPVRPFPARSWRVAGFLMAWRRSCNAAIEFIRDQRPDAVLGLGGYAAGPAVAAAVKMGVPAAILNPDAIPGRANRYLAKRVERVFCQWDVTVPHMPRPAACRVVGCPVRAGLDRLDKVQCRLELDLDPGRPLLLVTGASLGARTINHAAPAALARILDRLVEPWQVLHQTGSRTDLTLSRGPQTALLAEKFAYRTVEYIDRMDRAITAADLVLCRAGAGTLAELTAVGRAAVLMPYPFHRDQHQRHNGQVLVDAGSAVMIPDRKDAAANAEQLAPLLADLMTDAERRAAMAAAARAIGRPAAADAVVDELLRMAG